MLDRRGCGGAISHSKIWACSHGYMSLEVVFQQRISEKKSGSSASSPTNVHDDLPVSIHLKISAKIMGNILPCAINPLSQDIDIKNRNHMNVYHTISIWKKTFSIDTEILTAWRLRWPFLCPQQGILPYTCVRFNPQLTIGPIVSS